MKSSRGQSDQLQLNSKFKSELFSSSLLSMKRLLFFGRKERGVVKISLEK